MKNSWDRICWLLTAILTVQIGALVMSSYWTNKWANARDNWEEQTSKKDSPEEVLAGLSSAGRHQIGLSTPEDVVKQLLAGRNVGRSVTLTSTSGIIVADTTPLLELKGDDDDARDISIAIFAEIVSQTTVLGDIFGKIEWGSGGFQSSAEIDIFRGAVFNLNCSWVRVTAGVLADVGVTLKVGAFASYGHKSRVIPTQRTLLRDNTGGFIGSIAALGASNPIPLPNFCNTVQLLQNSTADVPYRLDFLDPTGAPLSRHFFPLVSSNSGYSSGIPVRFSGIISSVVINNLDAVNIMITPRILADIEI